MITRDEIVNLKNQGRMMPHLIPVESNAMDIPKRVQEIDPGYFVCFNPDNQRYEIHHSEQEFTLCLTLPFNELDSRAIDEIKRTKAENMKKIFEEIRAKNLKIQLDKEKYRNEFIEDTAKQIHKYCTTHESIERPDAGAFKTKFF